MENVTTKLLSRVADYYSGTLERYGATARGVDWNGEASQQLRFIQLSKLITCKDHFSVNDLGCGYGAFYDFLSRKYTDFDYIGVDIAEPMVTSARLRHENATNVRFIHADRPENTADFTVASGIFNIRMDIAAIDWKRYLYDTLDIMHQTSLQGFAFNCLTTYSDKSAMRPDLFYADPCETFDYCKRKYASQVALLHDYGLFEFTILVRKSL